MSGSSAKIGVTEMKDTHRCPYLREALEPFADQVEVGLQTSKVGLQICQPLLPSINISQFLPLAR
jgi:hypothetical protein